MGPYNMAAEEAESGWTQEPGNQEPSKSHL